MSSKKRTPRGKARRAQGSGPRTDAERAFVDRLLACDAIDTILLHGPPGTGKSYSALYQGRIDRGVFAVTMTDETPASELRGTWIPRGNEFEWLHGPIVSAMRAGARLVLNEVDHASSDTIDFLWCALESPETARFMLPSGEEIRPAPGYNVVATSNADPESLPLALRDRFQSIVEIREPHPDALARLRPALREAALRAMDIEPERRVSLRRWLQLERLLGADFSLEDACRATFGAERGAQIHAALLLGGGIG